MQLVHRNIERSIHPRERSFNAETITFTPSYSLTIAMVTKDFKENDTGLE
jgi:hypothetical protein